MTHTPRPILPVDNKSLEDLAKELQKPKKEDKPKSSLDSTITNQPAQLTNPSQQYPVTTFLSKVIEFTYRSLSAPYFIATEARRKHDYIRLNKKDRYFDSYGNGGIIVSGIVFIPQLIAYARMPRLFLIPVATNLASLTYEVGREIIKKVKNKP